MSEQAIVIAPMEVRHWPHVREIYEQGIASGNATFERQAPEWDAWDGNHMRDGRWVALLDDRVVGWAALTRVSARCVYAGVAESSVYVADDARGMGVGRQLMEALVRESERLGLWTLQAGVFPENDASIRVHTRVGFRLVGRREKIGQMDGIWRDVLLLERRSDRIGVGTDEGAAVEPP